MNYENKKILELKKQLRKKIRTLRFSKKDYDSRGLKLCAKVGRTRFFKDANAIGFYAALPDEIDVMRAAQKAQKLGKKIFFPRVCGRGMEFREIRDFHRDLKRGKFKILEPVAKRTQKRQRPLDLILIPGRAFDKKGRRLGRGVGYYDRLFQKWDCSVRMGVGFREQMVAFVPCEPHDVTMDVVLTA